ncbi:hypothetical protein C9374_005480 [Naegleria lovaniensis]|uniref:Protein kinase domain-containing protein n=1 Tax=Naegleria lovaniensis TaxID=51637 RepID=A0AA88KJW2_NAELO|nr:uncharacterized protein C9374_005480 [Naegleria lovaniensis]KAG2382278.1 hypothetical protein C9374_005480 [Naegleria lovaniensis]
MTKSFDTKLEEIHQRRQFRMRTNIWCEGSEEFNRKLCIAEDLLQVTWLSEHEDHNHKKANGKVSIITDLRKSIEQMSTHINSFKKEEKEAYIQQHLYHSRLVIERFTEAKEAFNFVNMSRAYQLLLDCLYPTKIDSLGEGSELFHTNTKYHKLLQLSALYGFKMNAVKFGQEDKVNAEHAHPDFLKVVAIIRMFHSTLLQNMKPSENHVSEIKNLVTYGLLTEKKLVRVIGIKVFVPEFSRSPKSYKYHLFNVGVFPIEPSTEEEKQQLDTLISFLLEASRQTIFEENELIKRITKESIGRKRLTSTLFTTSDFSNGDKLVIRWQKTTDTLLTTTITLEEYLFEISTALGQGNSPKDIFLGKIDHSSQPVFVKIFRSNRFNLPLGNIFLSPNVKVEKNGIPCPQYVEISIEGKELNSIEKARSCVEKMHIITQLLLEIDNIHTKKIIHNDIKPSNIIILEKENFKHIKHDIATDEKKNNLLQEIRHHPTFYCKFIDFELAKTFDEEDGNICFLYGDLLESTAGTSKYNAPEKEITGPNFIHPKTDIFSLGLVFIELIVEIEINKKQLENTNDEIWTLIEAKCKELDTSKGQIIFNMLRKMVNNQRKERITARQCLQLLDITETVDTQDYTSIFFPDNQISLNGFNNVTIPSMHDTSIFFPSHIYTYSNSKSTLSMHETNEAPSSISFPRSKKIVSHKKIQCCKCTTGNCRHCHCSKEGCTSCKSINCDNKRNSEKIGGSENENYQPESKKVKK